MNSESSPARYRVVEIIFFALALLVVGQAFRLLVDPKSAAIRDILPGLEVVQSQYTPPRGVIYDRLGRVLASNIKVYEIDADLRYVTDKETIAKTLAAFAGSDYSTIMQRLNPENEDIIYVTLDDYLSEDQVNAIRQQVKTYQNMKHPKNVVTPNLEGLYFMPHLTRTYPEGSLASNVLGFVNLDDQSIYGVEENYAELLSGQRVEMTVPLDPNRVAEIPRLPEGASVVLTINREVQSSMEQILDKALDDTGADNGVILVTDPETGEILAMATTPRMDLNDITKLGEIFTGGTPFNKAITGAYEPGSVYKVLTMAGALDSGTVTPETTFMDTGVIVVGGAYIYNWNGGAWGLVDMQGCMEHSLNVCLAWIATQMGPETFYKYMNAFGIGQLTGIDLGGEVAGRLKMPGDTDWSDADLGTNAFGQSVSATPIQMAMSIGSVANDGRMMTPHILQSVIMNGRQYNTQPQVIGTPITADTAHTLSEMLARSLENESSNALVPGYRVAGKTGTAEIPVPGGYSETETNASFVGWGPVDDPKFLVYVWLEKPETSPWGSVVAAPVFSEAVQRLVVLLNIPPDSVRMQSGQ